jgi:hypothetical protein
VEDELAVEVEVDAVSPLLVRDRLPLVARGDAEVPGTLSTRADVSVLVAVTSSAAEEEEVSASLVVATDTRWPSHVVTRAVLPVRTARKRSTATPSSRPATKGSTAMLAPSGRGSVQGR